ncbi:type VII secretion target [Amycolatopsis aidingensis]|uniref:type VII secretion target n=1 Tax=Amycolatopsis aidingensis TaxID=2842453 RepID=UPI001C0B9833|nr:type VII secretion target [Amycolatopsis aidingensis]
MPNIEVRPQSLRTAAKAATDAAEQVRELELTTVADLAAALPGAQAGTSAGRLGEHWKQDTRTWSDNMEGYADKLRVAAARYESDDQTLADELTGKGPL